MEIVIGFSRSKSIFAFFSLIIRLYLRTRYSHTYLKFYSNSLGTSLVYEAVGSGVRFVGTKYFQSKALEVEEFKLTLTEEEYKKLLKWCVENEGQPYGFLQNIGIVIANILKLKSNPFKKGVNCSEMIGRILANRGYKITKDFDLLDPKDINNILK